MTNHDKTTALAEARSAVLVFEGYSRPPLSENDRMKWQQRHRIVKRLRTAAGFYARAAGLAGLGYCRVTLTWHVATRHHRDADNVTPTLKAICDGLVDAGVVVDDIPRYMDKLMPVIAYEKGCKPRLELLVEQLPSSPDEHQEVPA